MKRYPWRSLSGRWLAWDIIWKMPTSKWQEENSTKLKQVTTCIMSRIVCVCGLVLLPCIHRFLRSFFCWWSRKETERPIGEMQNPAWSKESERFLSILSSLVRHGFFIFFITHPCNYYCYYCPCCWLYVKGILFVRWTTSPWTPKREYPSVQSSSPPSQFLRDLNP